MLNKIKSQEPVPESEPKLKPTPGKKKFLSRSRLKTGRLRNPAQKYRYSITSNNKKIITKVFLGEKDLFSFSA